DILWEQSRRLMRLVNDLLDTAKIEAGTFHCAFQDTEIPPVIAHSIRAVQQLAQKRQVHLETTIPNTLPLVRADPERLQRVVVNLVGNAIKFTPPGGRVDVTAEFARSRRHGRTSTAGSESPPTAAESPPFAGLESDEPGLNEYVAVEIRDSGIG